MRIALGLCIVTCSHPLSKAKPLKSKSKSGAIYWRARTECSVPTRKQNWAMVCFLIVNLLVALVGVTLVFGFAFLLQNVGRCWRHTNGTLSFYECRLSGGDTQRGGILKPYLL